MPSEPKFERSRELKVVFAELYELWSKKHRAGLEVLAARCGVSPAYLAHVRRYGRVPGRPVLVLLALNFGMKDPDRLFRAAGIRENWPYDPCTVLGVSRGEDEGLLTLRLDMDGFADAIRKVVRAELKPRSILDLLGNRPLRIGYNFTQQWLFDGEVQLSAEGFFPHFCEMLQASLHCRLEARAVDFSDYSQELSRGSIDVYGPIMSAPGGTNQCLFTTPLHRIGIAALYRKRQSKELEALPAPRTVEALTARPYKIAVVRHSRPHLLANTRMNRPDSALVICDSDEEALDRVLLKGVKKPAHMFICNAVMAHQLAQEHRRDLELLFSTKDTFIDVAENSLAVRPDWPELVPALNDAIQFILGSGGMTAKLNKTLPDEVQGLINVD